MGNAPLLMGIDVGTTAVKVVVYDIGGRERHRYAESYPTTRNGAFCEQDPADWMVCLSEAFDEIARAGLAPAIEAIGVTSQVNTHVFCAADGTPVHPAITWADTRARVVAASLDSSITEAERAVSAAASDLLRAARERSGGDPDGRGGIDDSGCCELRPQRP